MWLLPRAFGCGSSGMGMFPGMQEHQQVVFGHNALLYGAFGRMALQVVSVHGPLVLVSHSHPWSQRQLRWFALPPVGHARSTSSCLAPTRVAAQAALSCRFLERDSDRASGHCLECFSVAAAGRVCSQDSECSNRWYSITVSFCVVPSEVVGSASDFCSGIPSGGGPHPPGIRDNCGSLPLSPVDHGRSTLSHLAHIGCAAPAAPNCRVLGKDSDQMSGHHPEYLAVAAAGWLCSQGSESNSIWCLVGTAWHLASSCP